MYFNNIYGKGISGNYAWPVTHNMMPKAHQRKLENNTYIKGITGNKIQNNSSNINNNNNTTTTTHIPNVNNNISKSKEIKDNGEDELYNTDLTFEELKVLSSNDTVCNDYNINNSALPNLTCNNRAYTNGENWKEENRICNIMSNGGSNVNGKGTFKKLPAKYVTAKDFLQLDGYNTTIQRLDHQVKGFKKNTVIKVRHWNYWMLRNC